MENGGDRRQQYGSRAGDLSKAKVEALAMEKRGSEMRVTKRRGEIEDGARGNQ